MPKFITKEGVEIDTEKGTATLNGQPLKFPVTPIELAMTTEIGFPPVRPYLWATDQRTEITIPAESPEILTITLTDRWKDLAAKAMPPCLECEGWNVEDLIRYLKELAGLEEESSEPLPG